MADAGFCYRCGALLSPEALSVGPEAVLSAALASNLPTAASKGPASTTAALFVGALLALGFGLFAWSQLRTTSDAAAVWCLGHKDSTLAAGSELGVFPPETLPIFMGGQKYRIKQLRAMGVSETTIEALINADTLLGDWRSADSAGFARACQTAFDAR